MCNLIKYNAKTHYNNPAKPNVYLLICIKNSKHEVSQVQVICIMRTQRRFVKKKKLCSQTSFSSMQALHCLSNVVLN